MAKGKNITQQVYTKKSTLKQIYEKLNISKAKYVYDCCLGDGNWLEFEKEFNPDVILYGNDIDKKEVIKAIKRLEKTTEIIEIKDRNLNKKYKILTLFKINGKINLRLFHADSKKFNVWNHKEELFKNFHKFIKILDEQKSQ